MDRNKKILLGGAVLVVTLVLVVAFVAWPRHNPCIPMKTKPDWNTLKVTNYGSSQGHVVANMVGYVELLQDKTYLPLDISSVSVMKSSSSHDSSYVTLTGQCTSFTLKYDTKSKGKGEEVYSYERLDMLIKDARANDVLNKICSFDAKFDFEQPAASRYSCQQVRSHRCSYQSAPKKGAEAATLVLKSFELELDGEDKSVKKVEFSKPQWQQSCSAWEN